MNLYEFEGKNLFDKYNISTPNRVVVYRGDNINQIVSGFYNKLSSRSEIPTKVGMVAKAQILSGKRGKNNGIKFCSTVEEVESACEEMFDAKIKGHYVTAISIEEKLDIVEEHYLSITYDTKSKQPILIYSKEGGVDIEEVSEDKILKKQLEIKNLKLEIDNDIPYAQELWDCFLGEDTRLVEINPLVKTKDGKWLAVDAKVAIDDDAFFRHEEWRELAPRTEMGRPPTEREIQVKNIDKGEDYYRGTAGKYIEMDGDIAILFSGGGASIANMDALIKNGLKPANYTEYSGNPPREKVSALAKIVLSKPGLKGLWIAGGVANFTNVEETFQGIVDALQEVKPEYPIVVRRAGPFEDEGMDLMKKCAQENNLNIRLFGKGTSMSETAKVLADMIDN